jgi:hypothetical protein
MEELINYRKRTLSGSASHVIIRQKDFCRSRFNRFNVPSRIHVHWGTWQHGKSFISTVSLGVANLLHNYDYYLSSGSFPWISDSDQHSMQPTNHHQGVLLVHTLYLSSSFLRRLVPLHIHNLHRKTTSPSSGGTQPNKATTVRHCNTVSSQTHW